MIAFQTKTHRQISRGRHVITLHVLIKHSAFFKDLSPYTKVYFQQNAPNPMQKSSTDANGISSLKTTILPQTSESSPTRTLHHVAYHWLIHTLRIQEVPSLSIDRMAILQYLFWHPLRCCYRTSACDACSGAAVVYILFWYLPGFSRFLHLILTPVRMYSLSKHLILTPFVTQLSHLIITPFGVSSAPVRSKTIRSRR